MIRELRWLAAIERVLEESDTPLHYTEIANLIIENGYRISVGASPATTVNTYISNDMREFGESSSFEKVSMGTFRLKKEKNESFNSNYDKTGNNTPQPIQYTSIIQAYGMYWHRSEVFWSSKPDLYGNQVDDVAPVNFDDQKGIYLLYDGREIIYVGQAFDKSIGEKLFGHTQDSLNGRWDRFSWFGFYEVDKNRNLYIPNEKSRTITIREISETLEAIMVESIEPSQNKDRYDIFLGIEYKQVEDPGIKRKRYQQILETLSSSL